MKFFNEEPTTFEMEASDRGYRRFYDQRHLMKEGYFFSFRKKIMDGSDTLFALEIHCWHNKKTCEAEFFTQDNCRGQKIEVSTAFESFENSEEFFRNIWETMSCGRYDRKPDQDMPEISR